MLVSDDSNAVQSDAVKAVTRPDSDLNWSLTAHLEGEAVQLRFPSLDARDSFWKTLVEAMKA